jgi:phosphodiesterase/alkaline phosphatase D-like protein
MAPGRGAAATAHARDGGRGGTRHERRHLGPVQPRRETLRVVLERGPVGAAPATAEHDFTARVAVDGLTPATTYRYRAWCGGERLPVEAGAEQGAFRTAPARGDPAPVRSTISAPPSDVRSAPPWRPGQHLMPIGRAAFLDYAPMRPDPPNRFYRAFRWGRHLELFLLDTRQ